MALNLHTLKTRTISAIFFVIIMVAGLCWNFYSFVALFSIIHFGCWKEYQKLIGKIDPGYQTIHVTHRYGVMLLGWCIMLMFVPSQLQSYDVSISALAWWIALSLFFLLPVMEFLFARQVQPKYTFYSIAGIIYISLCWGLMIDLYFIPIPIFESGDIKTGIIPLCIIATIWINDTMAYIVGSLIGKTPLSPVSPKKTREGTIGGALLAIITVTGIAFLLHMPYFHIGVMSAIAAVTGTLGDLLESKLKRMANVKDSGSILPGHGGFLDRFDSLLLATPFVWIYCWLIYSY